MASCRQLDAARRAHAKGVIARLVFLLCLAGALHSSVLAQTSPSDSARLVAARAALDARQWEEAARLAQGPPDQSPDLDFVAGLALAHTERLKEAREAFEAGLKKAPRDPRFLVELAGIAYKQKNFGVAKQELRAALRLDPHDTYSSEFLATLFYLEGNLEAALKYWNAIDKPRLQAVEESPAPKLRKELLSRSITFNAPQVLTEEALLSTKAKLESLGIFPRQRFELDASKSADYVATIHLDERNGWGDSKLEGIVSLLSGLPYETVYPSYYNFGRQAINFTSLARWDSQKRRYSGELSAPLFHNPALRIKVYFDARNENWNLSQTFFAPGTPLTDLNLRRAAGGVEFRAVANGRWSWTAGFEFAHRTFQNLEGHGSAAEQPFFADTSSLASWLGADRSLLRIPEHRFTLDSSAEVRAGRAFNRALGPFVTARAALRAHWFPRATTDDYEVQAAVRAGATAGKTSLDELFQLGLERDNDLWLRGQRGTIDGRKGAAPLGRRYFLVNWEMDKNIYRGAFFKVKLGPFLDNGAIADSSGLFGSQSWLWDAGAQCKLQIFGTVTVVLSYGRDLRNGRDVFYGTVLR
ncbi:MAG TPA: tetratricopeptide repeat protein [Candidatus Acidoferrum sp.]|nr:tetratricopeptide repeat protein [Candidatus Acidoferrum sp.]